MPDFEALIRHQQTSRRSASDRLKVVQELPIADLKPTSDGGNLSTLFLGFLGGFMGGIVGTGLMFYLSAKAVIDFNLLF